MHRRRWLEISVIFCFALGCESQEAATPGERIPVGVYARFMPYREMMPELPALAARDAAITVAVPDGFIGDADLTALLRTAEERNVEVRIWPLLDRADGYWPNETNTVAFDTAVTGTIDWLTRENLRASTIVFDLEPSIAYTEEILAAFASADVNVITTLLRSHMDPVAFAEGRDGITAIIERIHAAGLRAECVTYPYAIDDTKDDDLDLQDAFDIPVTDVPWDEVSFMVYQTEFTALANIDALDPSLVRSYSADARTLFGDRATIALGLVDRVGIFEVEGAIYETPDQLRADVANALAEGITRVEVYSLDGMRNLGGTAGWMNGTIAIAAEGPLMASPNVNLARSIMGFLDSQLDAQ
jgi:hypothetical protein